MDQEFHDTWASTEMLLREHVERLLPESLDFAAAVGAQHLIAFSFHRGGHPSGPAPGRVIEVLSRAAELAHSAGISLIIENEESHWANTGAHSAVLIAATGTFNRYHTIEVVRGIVAAGAEDRITLYTGNDDHIVLDLVIPFTVIRDGQPVTMRFKGGLLGHWSVWTKGAVEIFDRCRAEAAKEVVSAELLGLDARVTDCNSAFFDVANNFHGCIAGCHEILRRQGLLEGIWCLDPGEGLSPGQAEELTRVSRLHADLADDDFVRANLSRWLD